MSNYSRLESYYHNYHVYNCYTNSENEFVYERISDEPRLLIKETTGKLIHINKNIPTFFHKMILYYSYIPGYF